jgi:DNA-directed RNA polymerase specialized sigma subunit
MASNPVVEFVQHRKEAAAERKTNELQQLQLWKSTGRQEHLQPLLKAYEPVIAQKMRAYKASSVPDAAFHAELKGLLINALETYDPSRGAALNTHVENTMRKAIRYNARFQNFAHIPEGQISRIEPITRAQNELTEMLGRDPTHDEIADHIGMPVKQVTRVLNAQIADIPSSKFESDPTSRELRRDDEILALLPHSLNSQENEVFQHLYGDKRTDGKQNMAALAKKLNLNSSQLSRIHSSIMAKYKSYK